MTHHRTLREKLVPGFLHELAGQGHRQELGGDANSQPRLLHSLIEDAVRARVSDIHIEPGSVRIAVRFRIDGVLSDVAALTPLQARMVINQVKALADLDPVTCFTPRDARATCPLESGAIDLRLALTPAQTGEALAIRLLDPQRLQRSIDNLGLPPDCLRLLKAWIEDGTGLFLSAGPTGSGKTTTIYALLHELKWASRAIVSFEDPVEYQVDGVVQVQLDERHHLNFSDGIKQMLRLDPDYVMLGEIRDATSARAAVEIAASGRALLSTLHSRDPVSAVTALRNWGLENHEIAEALSVVVGQRLVRQLCPRCQIHRPPNESELRWFASASLPSPTWVPEPAGCDSCAQLGYVGRTGLFDLWELSEADYTAILDRTDEHALRRLVVKRERHSFLVDGLDKLARGITSVAELRRATSASFDL